MREFVVAGLLISPLVRYALIAGAIFIPIRSLLVMSRFHRWFWHPLLAEAAVYTCILGLLDRLF
jgi:hypothetical protein